jgi:hypothetical protein
MPKAPPKSPARAKAKRKANSPIPAQQLLESWEQDPGCHRCQATDRGPFFGTITQDCPGLVDDRTGRPIVAILRHRTRCAECGQIRLVKVFQGPPLVA